LPKTVGHAFLKWKDSTTKDSAPIPGMDAKVNGTFKVSFAAASHPDQLLHKGVFEWNCGPIDAGVGPGRVIQRTAQQV